jgi:tetratricopeptide (TPR) repeat protein
MRIFPIVLSAGLLLGSACGIGEKKADHQAEWHHVMARKQAAAAPDATVAQKQAYADAVSAFVAKHPDHGRAREVYRRIQVEFADELSSLGRYQEAIRVYRAVLSHDPANQLATRGLNDAVANLTVTPEKLRTLERGMSRREVAQILGKPLPGWKRVTDRDRAPIEAWYYRTASGNVAGIYFRDGKLFAAEENSQDRSGRWRS